MITTSAALCPSRPQTQDRAPREQAGMQKSSAMKGAALASAGAEPAVILYFDKQRLARDCISEKLATHLPDWTIEPLASVSKLRENEDWSRVSLVDRL